ncbi:hypothetical protein [Mesorhizobium sangaii]|uniref:DUF4393 domain-containing protein n=1 Tax=Mesorhizobium sangaii TaxID=505389 RepID=A0A841PVU5_9HYPH|nr:hypothetical protein [Mesorhizobium sangaii]MBB6414252.1 hypothetical protein [Mesorhizobium sangaii]
MTKKEEILPIGSTKTDLAVSALKGLAGIIPGVGSIVGEIVGQVIPGQRMDRLELFAKSLHEQFKQIDETLNKKHFDKAEKIDLFEEGVIQSARAISQDRIEYISKIVAFGLTGEAQERIQAKRLLGILESLDDDQVIILSSYLHKNRDDQAFRTTHADILRPVPVHLRSDAVEVDKGTLHQLAQTQLRTLDLISYRYSKPAKGQLPEFDEKTGMMKAGSTSLTPLGRLLLQRIGLAGTRDY